MLYWALIFFVIAIVAAIFGFGGIAAGASSIAQVSVLPLLDHRGRIAGNGIAARTEVKKRTRKR